MHACSGQALPWFDQWQIRAATTLYPDSPRPAGCLPSPRSPASGQFTQKRSQHKERGITILARQG